MATFEKYDNSRDLDPRKKTDFITVRNLGNTCFLGASLQLILSIGDVPNEFRKLFYNLTYDRNESCDMNSIVYEILYGLKKMYDVKYRTLADKNSLVDPATYYTEHSNVVIERFIDPDMTTIRWIPTSLYGKIIRYYPDFQKNREEDADECVNILLDCFERSDISKHLWKRLFADRLKFIEDTMMKCTKCGHSSCRSQDSIKLNLDIPRSNNRNTSFDDIFENMTEVLEGYKCDNCSDEGNTVKTIQYRASSEYLLIQINRFNYDGSRNMSNIDLTEHIEFGGKVYIPQTIIHHHGVRQNSGHYVTSVFPNIIINDGRCDSTSNPMNTLNGVTAYIMLYRER